MKLNLKGKNIEITDGIKEYAEKRLQKLDKYFDKEFEVNATLSVQKDMHKIDVILPLSGFVIKGEDRTRDMYSTIDNVVDKIERQIRISSTNPTKEILMQKEVFDLLGIGRRRLKNWVDRGLNEIRVDNRVYYRYSDLMHFIENSSNH